MKLRVLAAGQSAEGVRAEFWGLLCLYQGISDVIDHVVLEADLEPDQISFTAATNFARRSVPWTDAAFPP